MKYIYLFIIYALFMSCNSSSRVSAGTQAKEEATKQIRKVYDMMSSHICNGDLENYMKLWAKTGDIEVLHPEYNEWQKGWTEVYNRYKIITGSGVKCSFVTNKFNVHLSQKMDMAWATSESILKFQGNSSPGQLIWGTMVLEKISDQWLVVHAFAGTVRPSK